MTLRRMQWVWLAASAIALPALVAVVWSNLGVVTDDEYDRPAPAASTSAPVETRSTPGPAGPPPPGTLATVQVMDPLPPVTDVPIVPAETAAGAIGDDEFVLGVVVGDEARAYPINMMGDPKREVLNDVLGGRPVAVTWCDQCQCPRAFSREVDGRTITLFVSGAHRDRNMILKDVETGSAWVQVLGESTDGPLKGKRLRPLAATWTDWKTWRAGHPTTSALMSRRVVGNYRHMPEHGDFAPERAYFDRLQFGLARDGRSRSWPFVRLGGHPVVNDTFDGRRLVVFFDRRGSTATAFDRVLDGRELTFRRDGSGVVDDQTGTSWDTITGRASAGPLRGGRLEPVAGTVSLATTWAHFHPSGEVWAPATDAPPVKP